ncbi:hypothetical protein MRB53_023809 [Persea americana]|uniref:Uncharacterized protein n=1 Tax=Persea americana TaxID=3435 RepID=A0ACC2LBA1_PERAE|nr:hypothetical protein MRB53_023809 [Persea americana]
MLLRGVFGQLTRGIVCTMTVYPSFLLTSVLYRDKALVYRGPSTGDFFPLRLSICLCPKISLKYHPAPFLSIVCISGSGFDSSSVQNQIPQSFSKFFFLVGDRTFHRS